MSSKTSIIHEAFEGMADIGNFADPPSARATQGTVSAINTWRLEQVLEAILSQSKETNALLKDLLDELTG